MILEVTDFNPARLSDYGGRSGIGIIMMRTASPLSAPVSICKGDEWIEHLQPKKSVVVTMTNRWEMPPTDFVKMNLDADFREESRSGG